MRLNPQQIKAIHVAIQRVTEDVVAVRLFGSRLDDAARGGDVDLMLDLGREVAHPAVLAARLAVQISRALDDRHVDVVLRAPNLAQTAIHRVALAEGVLI